MRDLGDRLAELMHDMADEAPRRPDLGVAVAARGRRQRLAGAAASGVAVAVFVIVSGVVWQDRRSDSGPTTQPSACEGAVESRVVPSWARDGFSDPEPVVPYATSSSSDVVAILFGGRLYAPQAPEVSNKVLWVAKDGGAGPARISARLEGTAVTAQVDLPNGLGPSSVDMPRPGCWVMDLAWDGGRRDTIALPYDAAPAAPPGSGTGPASTS